MKIVFLFFTAACAALLADPIVINSDASDWAAYPVQDLGTQNDADQAGGTYDLMSTYDDTNLYFLLDRSNTSRILGDTVSVNDSFFIAIDLDGAADSGATQDGYGRVNFSGTYRPDFILYCAGGSNWFESSTWVDGSSTWNGWYDGYSGDESLPDVEVSYAYDTDYDYDEIAVNLDYLGIDGAAGVNVWAWMTRESNGWKEAGWGVPTGDASYAGDGITIIPEPATLALLGLGALAARKR